jgi:polysaccharide export outer membrane protein
MNITMVKSTYLATVYSTTMQLLTALGILLLLASCGSATINQDSKALPATTVSDQPSESYASSTPGVKREIISLDQTDVATLEKPESDYLIGPGDVLDININGEAGMDALRVRVDANGEIQLPVVESINALGQSISTLQKNLKKAYLVEFKDPWIVVGIAEFRSHPLYFLGEFNSPGVIYMDGPVNLLQAIGLAGGMTSNSYLAGARLLREQKILPIDIKSLLTENSFAQNIWLQPDDTFYVPSYEDLNVFVLGAVNSPGAQPFKNTPTLLTALAQSAGAVSARAKLSETRIIRTRSPLKGELITVDAKSILNGTLPDFPLVQGDIIFVPNSAAGDWNEIIQRIAPTVDLVGGMLEPFVQYKFLNDND